MGNYSIPSSVQEAAANFANTILSSVNSAAAEMVGVDVMWFRATPDKRSQDVIFQAYTLYGVEDCPLTFRAMYSDAGYDDAAITYNIMGLNFQVPMTLEIALKTWENATGNDGTIPQDHDIVYIPISRKLMEVVSMTPVKQLGGQLTAYKVNLGIYKPTRSRLVGENLKESIKENTTNLDERFGKEIKETLSDIVDDNQLSIYNSTANDQHKKVTAERDPETGVLDVRQIVEYDLIVDGHTVARNYYNMNGSSSVVVRYKATDSFTKEEPRCLSFWMRIGTMYGITKNMKDMTLSIEDGMYYMNATLGKDFPEGTSVVLKRGVITVPGTVCGKNRILLNGEIAKKLLKMNSRWYEMPGFVLSEGCTRNVISGNGFSVSIVSDNIISVKAGENEKAIQISTPLKEMSWYGFIINLGEEFSADIYGTENGLSKIFSISGIANDIYEEVDAGNLYIRSSNTNLTNIRFYKTSNTETDKQITDLLSYNARNDSFAVVNDGADTFLSKPYTGKQR